MEVCYWALLFMPLVILHHLLNVFVQLANKRGFTKKKKKMFVGDVLTFQRRGVWLMWCVKCMEKKLHVPVT
jgi:hypothetical protein